jgi:AraC-like DNA-binding protein
VSDVHRDTVLVAGVDDMVEVVRRSYDRFHSLMPAPGTPRTSVGFAARAAASPELMVDLFRVGGAGSAVADSVERPGGEADPARRAALAMCLVRDGRLQFSPDRLPDTRFAAGDVYLYPEAGFDIRWSSVVGDMVRIPMSIAIRVAREETGPSVPDVRFTSMEPASPELARLWQATSELMTAQLLRAGGPAEEPLVRQALATTAATAALTVFPNTAADNPLAAGPGAVGDDTYHRAVAWADEHLTEPITATDVAAAVGATARDLASVFRSRRGTDVDGYLRLARLSMARAAVLDLDPDDSPDDDPAATIGRIAARYGFPDVAAFTRLYRREFGRRPGDDLPT